MPIPIISISFTHFNSNTTKICTPTKLTHPHTNERGEKKKEKTRGGLFRQLQWNLRALGEVEDMIWQFTPSVCLNILTPWLEVKLRSFPRPAQPAGGCSA